MIGPLSSRHHRRCWSLLVVSIEGVDKACPRDSPDGASDDTADRPTDDGTASRLDEGSDDASQLGTSLSGNDGSGKTTAGLCECSTDRFPVGDVPSCPSEANACSHVR